MSRSEEDAQPARPVRSSAKVTVNGPKEPELSILVPCRKETQNEQSYTDQRALGLSCPVRESGVLAGSPAAPFRPLRQRGAHQGCIIASATSTDPRTRRAREEDKEIVRWPWARARPDLRRGHLPVSPAMPPTCTWTTTRSTPPSSSARIPGHHHQKEVTLKKQSGGQHADRLFDLQ